MYPGGTNGVSFSSVLKFGAFRWRKTFFLNFLSQEHKHKRM